MLLIRERHLRKMRCILVDYAMFLEPDMSDPDQCLMADTDADASAC